MLIVDASCLVETLIDGPRAEEIRERFTTDTDHAAPHAVDAEVFGVIRREYLRGNLDHTAASLAIEGLADWPGQRFGHRPLLERAWQLRDSVRGWDAMYVALAEAFDAPLLTLDRRLASASGPSCRMEVFGHA